MRQPAGGPVSDRSFSGPQTASQRACVQPFPYFTDPLTQNVICLYRFLAKLAAVTCWCISVAQWRL